MKYFFIIILIFISSSNNLFAENSICNATIIKGEVKIQLPDGKIQELTKELMITEGATILTGEKSFVKLVFIDQSMINLGSSSEVKITSFTKNNPGIISLIRGQIRSQVTKNYMELEDKNKSKLFIRTTTAALGIRGTDFQVNFEKKREETTLVTFEGKVAMNKLDSNTNHQNLNQRDLDKILERNDRIVVSRGEFSNVNRDTRRMEPPRRMDSKLMDNLMKSEIPRERIMERGPRDLSNNNQNDMRNGERDPEKKGENDRDQNKDKDRKNEGDEKNNKQNERSSKDPREKGGKENGPGGNQNGGPGNGPGGNQNGGPGNGPGGKQNGGPGNGPGGNQNGGPGNGPGGNQNSGLQSNGPGGKQGPGNPSAGGNAGPKDDRRGQTPPPP